MKNTRKIGLGLIGLFIILGILVIFFSDNFSEFFSWMFGATAFFSITFSLSLIWINSSINIRTKAKWALLTIALLFLTSALFLILNKIGFGNPALVIGVFIYCFSFAPLQLKDKYLKWKAYSDSNLETAILSSFDFIGINTFLIGTLFKFMWWPGANILMITGGIFIAIGIFAWNFRFKKDIVRRKENEEKIKEQYSEIQASINYAKRIQTALLTTDEHWNNIGSEHFILFKPRDVVSGDFFWAYSNDEISIWVAADCTGHGVPGAFMSMLGVGFLNEIVSESGITDASKILNLLRAKIISAMEQKGMETQQKDGMDIALCVLNKSTKILQYAGAYNPLLHIRNGELTEIKADKQPIGKHMKDDVPFNNKELQLEKGDAIYTYSDGYIDQFGGPNGKKFMSKNFKKLLITLQNSSLENQKETLDSTIENWMKESNTKQIDDICIVGVKI